MCQTNGGGVVIGLPDDHPLTLVAPSVTQTPAATSIGSVDHKDAEQESCTSGCWPTYKVALVASFVSFGVVSLLIISVVIARRRWQRRSHHNYLQRSSVEQSHSPHPVSHGSSSPPPPPPPKFVPHAAKAVLPNLQTMTPSPVPIAEPISDNDVHDLPALPPALPALFMPLTSLSPRSPASVDENGFLVEPEKEFVVQPPIPQVAPKPAPSARFDSPVFESHIDFEPAPSAVEAARDIASASSESLPPQRTAPAIPKSGRESDLAGAAALAAAERLKRVERGEMRQREMAEDRNPKPPGRKGSDATDDSKKKVAPGMRVIADVDPFASAVTTPR